MLWKSRNFNVTDVLMQPFCNKRNQVLASDQVAKATSFALSTNFIFVMQPPKKEQKENKNYAMRTTKS